jgi:hypothetical protein
MIAQKNIARNRIRVTNAFIDEIDYRNREAFVTISYGVPGNFSMTLTEVVILIVNWDTMIRDRHGQRISVNELRVGMRIDAEFSAAMTRSIPPQARAYRITVISEEEFFDVTVGTVLWVDTRNGFLYTGTAHIPSSQIRFVITDATRIINRRGKRIRFKDLKRGETVRIEHADFLTPSIPPQTTAFQVRVL